MGGNDIFVQRIARARHEELLNLCFSSEPTLANTHTHTHRERGSIDPVHSLTTHIELILKGEKRGGGR